MKITYRELTSADLLAVKEFTDQWIGANYFSMEELYNCYEKSLVNKDCTSFIALDGDKVVGVRLTYAPGEWIQKDRGFSPKLWKSKTSNVAYFKSLFVHGDYQQMGIGRKLSQLSLEKLKQLKTEAIICHSWLESPQNSSQKYLSKLNFHKVKEHKKFWHEIDYDCTRCAPIRCECTAVEMIKYI